MTTPRTIEQIAREAAEKLQDCYEYHKAGPNFDRAEGERIILAAIKEAQGVDKDRLDWLDNNIDGSFGPARRSDDEHPIHIWSFSAPVYEPERGGLRSAIDAAMQEPRHD